MDSWPMTSFGDLGQLKSRSSQPCWKMSQQCKMEKMDLLLQIELLVFAPRQLATFVQARR